MMKIGDITQNKSIVDGRWVLESWGKIEGIERIVVECMRIFNISIL